MQQKRWLAVLFGTALLAVPVGVSAQGFDASSSHAYAVFGDPESLVVCDANETDCHVERNRGSAEESIVGYARLEKGYGGDTIVLPAPEPTLHVGMGHDLAVTPLPEVSKIWLRNHPEAWGK